MSINRVLQRPYCKENYRGSAISSIRCLLKRIGWVKVKADLNSQPFWISHSNSWFLPKFSLCDLVKFNCYYLIINLYMWKDIFLAREVASVDVPWPWNWTYALRGTWRRTICTTQISTCNTSWNSFLVEVTSKRPDLNSGGLFWAGVGWNSTGILIYSSFLYFIENSCIDTFCFYAY